MAKSKDRIDAGIKKENKNPNRFKGGVSQIKMGNNDVLFILLGATGDLTKRKLLPAIYHLVNDHKIAHFAIIGVARSPISVGEMLAASKPFVKEINAHTWKKLEAASYYLSLDFYHQNDYHHLKKIADDARSKHHLSGNTVFYFSTLPDHFETITKNIHNSGLAEGKGWSRLVYEKPFGSDLASARRINKSIARFFTEEQVFRIDHYLGKDIVGNLALLRFTNRALEPLWNRNHIESVQILFLESLGIEGRGNFYDKYGALKDVVQNHMLQLLALTAMEAPRQLTGHYIRDEKAKVLNNIIVHNVVRGQYDGYLQEKGVSEHSSTETFTAVHLEVNNKRWKGVPFYLKAGKKLDKKETSIHLRLKSVPCLLPENCPTDSNHITIKIEPHSSFALELFARVPGKTLEIIPMTMEFSQPIFTLKSAEAYEILLEEVIKGEQSLFVRNDEIEQSWKIMEAIEKIKTKVYTYAPGSKGPQELKLLEKEHIKWRG
ncbi:MAG: glucose-6-phosphate dehydrogenase [Nanoarchaeota archaeon]|nr:glucose-6-phosphate dehydrogenase [Nanoarchaeota archaeon]